MKALLLSGLWPTADFNGLQQLGDKLKAFGIDVTLKHYDDPSLTSGYDIYIGHSLGASKCLDLIRQSPSAVKYFAAIEFVIPSWFPIFFFNAWNQFKVPANVERCDAFQRSWALIPPSSKILNPDATFENYLNLPMSHADAPRYAFVVTTILNSIKGLQ